MTTSFSSSKNMFKVRKSVNREMYSKPSRTAAAFFREETNWVISSTIFSRWSGERRGLLPVSLNQTPLISCNG